MRITTHDVRGDTPGNPVSSLGFRCVAHGLTPTGIVRVVTNLSQSSHRSLFTTTINHLCPCPRPRALFLPLPRLNTCRRPSRRGPSLVQQCRWCQNATKNGQSDALSTLDTKSGRRNPQNPEWRGIEGRGRGIHALFCMCSA